MPPPAVSVGTAIQKQGEYTGFSFLSALFTETRQLIPASREIKDIGSLRHRSQSERP